MSRYNHSPPNDFPLVLLSTVEIGLHNKENSKKQRLKFAEQQLTRAAHFFVHFFALPAH